MLRSSEASLRRWLNQAHIRDRARLSKVEGMTDKEMKRSRCFRIFGIILGLHAFAHFSEQIRENESFLEIYCTGGGVGKSCPYPNRSLTE